MPQHTVVSFLNVDVQQEVRGQQHLQGEDQQFAICCAKTV